MRSGHLGYRKAHASRPSLDTRPAVWRGAVRPLNTPPPPLAMGLRAISTGEPAGYAETSQSIADYLPLNLRSILAQDMFPAPNTDGCAPNPRLRRGPSDSALREFARAVRSFAAMRAREHWIECAVSIRELEEALASGAHGESASFICLKCAVMGAAAESALHPEPGCIVAPLGGSSARRSAPERARRAIEKFRAAREVDGLSHYDLDCYVSKGRMVFTWRPPAQPAIGH